MKTWKEYWVEYNWENSKWGERPNDIRSFRSKAEAVKFAKTVPDAKISEVNMRQQTC